MSVINGIDLELGGKIVETVKNEPEFGQMLWRVKTVWEGGARSVSEMRGYKIIIDEPVDMGGSGQGPTPVEVILSGLGSCLAVGYSLNAAAMGIELQKIEIELEGELDAFMFLGLPADIHPGFTKIKARVFLKSATSYEKLEELHQKVVSTSPVGMTLKNAVDVEVQLEKRKTA